MNIPTLVIIAYLSFFMLFGIALNLRNRKSRSSNDWATSGGTMGVLMLAAGVAGTRIGGAGTYGVAGDVMTSGIGNLWYGLNSLFALVLVGVFFAVPYRRLKLSSIGEVFDRRFGSKRCQVLTSLCVQTEYLIINIIEPFIIGTIVSGVTGLPFVVGVYIGGFVIILTTVSGGLKGTAITNVIHCAVIILGLALVGFVVMQDFGGWQATVERVDIALASANMDKVSWWSFTGIGWATIIALFFSATLHTPAASVYVNFSSSAKSESTLLPAFILAGILAAIMPMLAGIIGLEALAAYGSESGLRGYITITKLATDAGPFIGGIALAAVLAALISSGAPILLGSSTMLVNDWIPGSKNFTPETKLKAYKITAVLYGLIAATIAWQVQDSLGSVLKLLLLGFAMVVPPAIAITFMFYVKRTSEIAVFWSIAAGFFGGLSHWGLNTLFANTQHQDAGGFGQFWYEFSHGLGEWSDPTFSATLIPLVVIVGFVIIAPEREKTLIAQKFYSDLGRN
jgi:SSS family solute:Na+ symporter